MAESEPGRETESSLGSNRISDYQVLVPIRLSHKDNQVFMDFNEIKIFIKQHEGVKRWLNENELEII